MAKGDLTTKQRAALAALLAGASYTEAAAAAGVHPNRVSIWIDQPAFIAALRSAESERLQAVSRSLVSIADKATATLDSVLDNDRARDSSKLRAADIVLSRLLQLRELVTLEQRVSELEKRLPK